MLLSIVVLSYNRPEQINRILKNIITAMPGNFNLIIKDDVSPRQEEINKIVNDYKGRARYEIIFHKNKKNLGYDRNLIDAFNITDADYVFLLSDDDYIDGEYLAKLCELLLKQEHKVYFTPYSDGKKIHRNNIRNFNINKFQEVIYNSILFSGLIFDRKSVIKLPKDENFLSTFIYTQVFLSSLIIFNEKSFGEAPRNLLYLGGDGPNFFGKNQSSVNQTHLQDRKEPTSNLKYQQFLIKVVREISLFTDIKIYKQFKNEYNRRLIAYLIRVRALGLDSYYALTREIQRNEFADILSIKIIIFIMPIVPARLAELIYNSLKNRLKKSG